MGAFTFFNVALVVGIVAFIASQIAFELWGHVSLKEAALRARCWIHPRDAACPFQLALLLRSLGDRMDEAAQAFNRSAALNPDNGAALFFMARVVPDPEIAINAFRRAAVLLGRGGMPPRPAHAWHGLGSVLYVYGRIDEAIAAHEAEAAADEADAAIAGAAGRRTAAPAMGGIPAGLPFEYLEHTRDLLKRQSAVAFRTLAFRGRSARAGALLARLAALQPAGAWEAAAAKAKYALLLVDDTTRDDESDEGHTGGTVAAERAEAARWMRDEVLPRARASADDATRALGHWFQYGGACGAVGVALDNKVELHRALAAAGANFAPEAFVVPDELEAFSRRYWGKEQGKETEKGAMNSNKRRKGGSWLYRAAMAANNRGTRFITSDDLLAINACLKRQAAGRGACRWGHRASQPSLLARYVGPPVLFHGRKAELRMYVVTAPPPGVPTRGAGEAGEADDPHVFVWRGGLLAKASDVKYRPPRAVARLPPLGTDQARRYARPHVTNVNEEKEKSVGWRAYRDEVERQYPGAFDGAVWPAAERLAGAAVRAGVAHVRAARRNATASCASPDNATAAAAAFRSLHACSFSVLGFDFLVVKQKEAPFVRPVLMEVNVGPGFNPPESDPTFSPRFAGDLFQWLAAAAEGGGQQQQVGESEYNFKRVA